MIRPEILALLSYVNALINASNAVSDRFDRRAVAVQNGVGR
jgi:hypothetical protein